MEISYFAFFGTLYLLILTYQDYKNKMMVDDRKNFFMMGIAISLYSHIHPPILYVLFLIGLVMALNIFLKKWAVFGEADINTFSWMYLGFGIMGIEKLILLLLVFAIMTGLYTMLKVTVFKLKGKAPFYYVILLTFVLSCFMGGVY